MSGENNMHIGERIQQELERQGKTVVWLARQLAYSRANIYKIFDRPTIDTEVLLRISRVLHYDFFDLYSEEIGTREQNAS